MDNKHIDQATAVRSGEELDIKALHKYLQKALGTPCADLEISQFANGYSNLTYLISCDATQYVLRKPPKGANVKSGHDMHREYRILSALAQTYTKAPKAILFCDDHSIMGCDWYLMERVRGVILRAKMSQDMTPAPDLMSGIALSMVDTMVELHALDLEQIGLADLGRPVGYVTRQVDGWTRRIHKAKTSEIPAVEYVGQWLADNQPTSTDVSLIHNDYKYDNLVLDSEDWTRVVAVLDWEMTTIGDPLMDLGTTLGYWINHDDPLWMKQLALSPTTLPGNPRRSEIADMYAEASGRDISDILFYYVYGLYKIAGITQQIYYRYHHGHTKDPRFAGLGKMVTALGEIAKQATKTGRLD